MGRAHTAVFLSRLCRYAWIVGHITRDIFRFVEIFWRQHFPDRRGVDAPFGPVTVPRHANVCYVTGAHNPRGGDGDAAAAGLIIAARPELGPSPLEPIPVCSCHMQIDLAFTCLPRKNICTRFASISFTEFWNVAEYALEQAERGSSPFLSQSCLLTHLGV